MIKEIDGKRWYCCPRCGQKLFRVIQGSTAKAILVFCRHCKHEIEVNI